MKAKGIITALLLMVAGWQTAMAQKVLIYKADKTTIELEVLDVDSIVFVEAEAKLVTEIKLSETSITLQPNETEALTANVLPEDADNRAVTWESSDEAIATVSNEGIITAIAEGTCTIICRATDGSGVKATCEVAVTKGEDIDELIEIGLPVSTMISSETQWAAEIMVFNDTERWGTDAAGQVIGTPPSDTNGNEWYELDYELTDGQKSWSVGYSPFLAEKFDEPTAKIPWIIWPNSTRWSTGQDIADIYLRRTFTVDHELSDKIFLSCCHDDNAEWYLNGVLIHAVEGQIWDYGYDKEQIYLTPEQRALIFTDGRKNVLAIHVHNYGGPALADGGLYNSETERGLPTSTMVSPKTQWAADMMIFNNPDYYGTDNEDQVIDTPPSDINGNEWYAQDYQLTDGQKFWSVGYSPFLSEKLLENIQWTIWPNSTQWAADKEVADIYLRRTFTVNHEISDNIFLSCCHDDGTEWYLNGVLIYSADNWNYDINEKVYLTPEQRSLIHTDGQKNVLAIHTHNRGGVTLADGGLYEESNSSSNHEGVQGTLVTIDEEP